MVKRKKKRSFAIQITFKGKKKPVIAPTRFTKKGAMESVSLIKSLQRTGIKRVGKKDISKFKKLKVVKVK